MNQQLIPIIAAYWGAECSYESVFKGASFTEQIYLNEYSFYTIPYENFKLHLRPLWSITEEELRELGEAIGEIYTSVDFEETGKTLIAGDEVSPVEIITIGKNGSLVLGGDDNIKIINHLRAKGFCVDQELVDANLVEWKEAQP